MTREGLRNALVDLGWISLMRRALETRGNAEIYALRALLRRPGTELTLDDLARQHEGNWPTKATDDAIRKRIERAREALDDIGCPAAITTLHGQRAYMIHPADAQRIERSILAACGIDLEPIADVAA